MFKGKEQDQGLKDYYGNRKLMWQNLSWLIVLNGGWTLVFGAISPLMQLRMNSPQVGMGEGMIATIGAINGYVVSFLVMYFSWKSDHTISRWGRRIPYLWVSAPGIIITVAMFPFIDNKWILLGVLIVQMFFSDWKASTISLLGIDMVPRSMLARTGSIQTIAMSLIMFLSLRYGMRLPEVSESFPYLLGAGVLIITSLLAGSMMKEPPIKKPQTEPFKPWSALKVGWKDRRLIVLMVGTSLLNATSMMYGMWVWLFAKNVLHLTRTDMGASLAWATLLTTALAYPAAWMLDRFNPYKMVGLYVLMQLALCITLMTVHNATGLVVVSFVAVLSSSVSSAAGLILWRSMPAEDVGSITAAAAFLNNALNATLIFASGQLIERLGKNYYAAFIFGFGVTLCGFTLLMVFRHLMKKPSTAVVEPTPIQA